MGSKEKIIHKWTEPATTRIHEAKRLWKRAKVGIPCILVIVLVIEVILYFVITNLVPQEIQSEMELSWFKLFRSAFIGSTIVACLLYLVMIGGTRFGACIYELTESGIRATGLSSWVLRWEHINAYSVSQHEDIPSVSAIRLYGPKRTKCFSLSENAESEEIIKTVKSKVIMTDDSRIVLDSLSLSKSQWLFLLLLTLPYLGLTALFPAFARYDPSLGAAVIFLPMLIGPGFVGFRLLFGKEWSLSLNFRRYAIMINLITFMLVFLCVFVLGFYFVSRQFHSFYS